MSRKELETWSCGELAKYCKEHNIPHYNGKNRFRKSEMVEAILKEQEPMVEEPAVESEIEESVSAAVKEKEAADVEQLPGTLEYLENIKVGTLVAFKEESGKLNTAAVQNVSFKRNQLRLVTQYGKEFIVPFGNVIWVRTSKRWPKFVLDILKSQQRKGQQNAARREERKS